MNRTIPFVMHATSGNEEERNRSETTSVNSEQPHKLTTEGCQPILATGSERYLVSGLVIQEREKFGILLLELVLISASNRPKTSIWDLRTVDTSRAPTATRPALFFELVTRQLICDS
jgi:hypothetical protein